MRGVFLALACALSIAANPSAFSADYPSRPITMIVPFGPGGPTDAIARVIADGMQGALGQPVIIKNAPGAAGIIGVRDAAGAPADGYTLSIGHWGTHAVNGLIYPEAAEALAGLQPVSLLASNPYLILSRRNVPATDLRSLIAWLKDEDDKALSATNGPGSAGYLIGTRFKQATGTAFRFVPYSGGIGASKKDLIGGHIDLMFDQAATSVSLVHSGLAKAYAVTSKARIAIAPEIPTADEAGLPDFHMSAWHGLWVPKGTPPATVAKIRAAVANALKDAKVRDKLAKLGQEIPDSAEQTPEALASRQRDEIATWRPIIEPAQPQSH
jgi:tripartite-type tricarboxylate transporter receptor subunit TctC